MKKLVGLFIFVCTMAFAINFYGHQSIVNLGTTRLFTAPASAIYFINGTLTLPHLPLNGNAGNSEAVVQVSKNGVTSLYYGPTGANGFTIPAVALVSNDSISASVTSNASIDQGLNVIKGDVFFGNAY